MNKFIVLDINHGGDYLAAILKNRGYEVIVYDIYHKGGEKKQKLNEKNIRVFEDIRGDHLDYNIAYPVHCPEQFFSLFPNNNKITHHELVKFLFNHRKKIIEITGSKGKTTTANLLAFLLSFEEEILLNNSTGFQSFINGNSKLIDKENSISAGYTAKILSQEYNKFHVLEESLGVCGVGDVSILTSMNPIYNIKAGNGNSVDAKKQLFKLSENKIIIDSKDKIANNIANEYKKEVFRIGEDINIITPDTLEVGKDVNSTIYIKDLELISKFKGSYLLAGYVNPILFSVMSLKILDKDLENVISNLSRFDGVKNRLSVIIENSITKIIDKSGGFSEASLRYLLSLLKRHYDIYYKNINLLIDLNNVSHCQQIDLNALDAVIGEFGNLVDNAFLVGNYDFERFKYLKNSSELITQKGDLLIECGK
ncbi:MAG: UDP-N-acetylmuramoyl-L-alanyl-D-glutamate synthetase [Candidatus Methanofastidiosum methylothiophilum]|uniref:UDP-N-acetylmuramoyl-L-alanyl-D-glutamate synthetase n=1 Tax=Candidatus Methanofastidiosum methylothiophilum TaxID=1705564 RepID=A0A150IKT6_9EURY|nr:MAG: UDP-N-acetylmuramoyl-L-alanyl-D-glutamate synthetase [Candidatus Methanofastidiosum methylthiophilus]KYC47734.1 MAG: UDP-N-acetylmuramoyl-L-alanyl-D-glutamate synthetase [Candidatus Methanofastidiosum methylthiophilus]KYC50505.1 MAG: UDP-N-acetylmuramoyl-L-alanyl-D-glutamate synthetase [Candidatus Methanofastidiosum methylthiophilus]